MKINRASNLRTCYLQPIFIKTVVEHEMLQVTSVFLLVKKPTIPPIHQPISRYPNTRKAWWWSYIVIAIFVVGICTLPTWNLKHPLKNGCFHWMSPNLYMKNGCFTKHPLKSGCLGFQVPFNLNPPPVRGKNWTLFFLGIRFSNFTMILVERKCASMPNKHEEWHQILFDIEQVIWNIPIIPVFCGAFFSSPFWTYRTILTIHILSIV